MQWQAKWIWVKEHTDTANCYIYARREIDLPAVSDANAHVACSSSFKLYVNGQYIGRGAAKSGPHFFTYNRYDIKRYLRPGRNVIAAICHNYGVDTSMCRARPGGFLLQIDSSSLPDPLVSTDHRWRVKLADDWDFGTKRASSSLDFQETYDSRKKPFCWNIAAYDDTAWEEPEVVALPGDPPWGELVLKPIPNLSENAVWPIGANVIGAAELVKHPQNLLRNPSELTIINPGQDVSIILDFGERLAGYPNIRIRDGGSTAVDVSYSDALDVNGFLCQTPGVYYKDKLIVHGGRQEWQVFGRRSFRYMRLDISGMLSPVHIESVTTCKVNHLVKQAWRFECSDARLNESYKNSINLLSLCMQEWYERDTSTDPGSYPSDARIKALANCYRYADFDFTENNLIGFSRMQKPDGSLDIPLRSGHSFNNPLQAANWVLMLHDYYLQTGDMNLVELLHPNLSLVVDSYLLSKEGSNGLLVNSRGEAVSGWNAFYYQALRSASKIAVALEHFDEAQKWNARAVNVLREFNDRFWSDKLSSYAASKKDKASDSTNILAVALGLANITRCDLLRERLALCATQFMRSYGFYVLQAMARLDMMPEAMDQIIASPGVAAAHFLPSEVLGIKASTPQSPVTIVQPKTAGLEWGSGGYDLPTSSLCVEWRKSSDRFSIDIEGPDGFIAALPVDGFTNPVVHEIDLTPETPERRARKTYGWGDVIWSEGRERDPYIDWLKLQEADPPDHYTPRSRLELQGDYVWVREPISHKVRYVVLEDL